MNYDIQVVEEKPEGSEHTPLLTLQPSTRTHDSTINIMSNHTASRNTTSRSVLEKERVMIKQLLAKKRLAPVRDVPTKDDMVEIKTPKFVSLPTKYN